MRSQDVVFVFCLASLSIPASILGRRSSCLVVVLKISLARLVCVVWCESVPGVFVWCYVFKFL